MKSYISAFICFVISVIVEFVLWVVCFYSSLFILSSLIDFEGLLISFVIDGLIPTILVPILYHKYKNKIINNYNLVSSSFRISYNVYWSLLSIIMLLTNEYPYCQNLECDLTRTISSMFVIMCIITTLLIMIIEVVKSIKEKRGNN